MWVSLTSRDNTVVIGGGSAFCPAMCKCTGTAGISAEKSGEIFPNPGQKGGARSAWHKPRSCRYVGVKN